MSRHHPEPAYDRIMKRLVPQGDCLVWPGATTRPRGHRQGYGQVTVDKRRALVHRVVLDHHIPCPDPTLFALHSCDVPLCCNIEHLRWGTRIENAMDMLDRNRNVVRRGENAVHSKLTNDDVRAIRLDRATTKTPYHTLAARYGVSTSSACDAALGHSWAHLD